MKRENGNRAVVFGDLRADQRIQARAAVREGVGIGRG